jgi:hypothetical protein
MVIANLNGDNIPDLVVGAPSRNTNGAVFIYYGDGGLSSLASCVAPGCQEIGPPTAVAGLYGTDISAAGNVGDLAGEGKNDLLVAQPTFTGDAGASTGRAILYFGTTAATIDTATYIEFRGVTGYSYASAARIIKSIDSDATTLPGDPALYDEVLITAHTFTGAAGANQGRVYIFKGRSVTDWQALAGAKNFVLPSQADWILEGPSPVAAGTGGNQFARLRFGIQSLGDLNTDGVADFSIPISKETDGTNEVQRMYVYSGKAVAATTAATPVPTSSAAVLNTLTPQRLTALGTGTGTDAFGRSAVGALNIYSPLDLLVAYPTKSRLHLFTSPLTQVAGAASVETMSSSSAFFGYVTAATDLTGDGKVDILAGSVPAGGAHQAWILYQRPGTTRFDQSTGSYWGSEFRSSATGSKLGQMVLMGDLTGDGIPEVILGDEGLNSVQIWKSN